MAEEAFCVIDADEVQAMTDALLGNQSMASAVGKIQDYLTQLGKIQDYLTQLDNVQLNIAVTGESGSGKSTFVNAFRGLGDEGPNSAPTGVVETTKETKGYPCPKYPNVTLWDLPGIGSDEFKAEEYLVDVEFKRYDFFIIVASGRFRECHVLLASEIQKMKKNFYFLRNKIDNNIAAEKRKKTFTVEKTLEAIRQECIKGLEKNNVAAPDVFLISCFELGHYDFNRLHDAIEKELPKQKRHVLVLTLPNITMKIHEKKKTALQADIWKVALLSGIVATVPVPGLPFTVDVGILLKEIKKYYTAFGLDDESLQKLAEISTVSVEELKAVMKYTQHMKFTIKSVIAQLITTTSFEVVQCYAEYYIFSLVPIIGSSMSFATTHYLLKKYLEELATDAKNVLMKALSV